MKKSIVSFVIVLCLLLSNISIASAHSIVNTDRYTFIENGNITKMINPEGEIFILEEVDGSERILYNEDGTINYITKDILGNVYIDKELVIKVESVKKANTAGNLMMRTYGWVDNGYRRYSTDFSNRSKESAIAALSLIPGWGKYAAMATTIAHLWTKPSKTLYFHEACQIRSDGYSKRYRTYTYENSDYTGLLKDSGWGSEIRIHW